VAAPRYPSGATQLLNFHVYIVNVSVNVVGIVFEPGRLTYIGTRLTEIHREPHPYSTCTDTSVTNITRNIYELLHPVSYSQTACYNTCLQRNIMGIFTVLLHFKTKHIHTHEVTIWSLIVIRKQSY